MTISPKFAVVFYFARGSNRDRFIKSTVIAKAKVSPAKRYCDMIRPALAFFIDRNAAYPCFAVLVSFAISSIFYNRTNSKISAPVISSISIDVVDQFFFEQVTPQDTLHYLAMKSNNFAMRQAEVPGLGAGCQGDSVSGFSFGKEMPLCENIPINLVNQHVAPV